METTDRRIKRQTVSMEAMARPMGQVILENKFDLLFLYFEHIFYCKFLQIKILIEKIVV